MFGYDRVDGVVELRKGLVHDAELRERTPSPSNGPYGQEPNAWTGCSCSAAVTWGRCFGPSPLTTTRPGPTEHLGSRLRSRGPIRVHGCSTPYAFEGATSWLASSMSMNPLLEAESEVYVPFRMVSQAMRSAPIGSSGKQASRRPSWSPDRVTRCTSVARSWCSTPQ